MLHRNAPLSWEGVVTALSRGMLDGSNMYHRRPPPPSATARRPPRCTGTRCRCGARPAARAPSVSPSGPSHRPRVDSPRSRTAPNGPAATLSKPRGRTPRRPIRPVCHRRPRRCYRPSPRAAAGVRPPS
ncbi:DUF7489 domain-containing protein [Streptomyces lavendulae]